MPKFNIYSEDGTFLGTVMADSDEDALRIAKAHDQRAHDVEEKVEHDHERP